MGRVITQEELDEATPFGHFNRVYLLADEKTIVKASKTMRVAEAIAMKFVRQYTSVPVPEVYNVYTDEKTGRVYIVMEYIEGTTLDEAWAALTEEEKESVVQQLRGYFNELRQISRTSIGAVDYSACDDQFFSDDLWAYGPYNDEAEFNQGLAKAWSKNGDDPHTRLLIKALLHDMRGHNIVLTHGKFAARNILVRGAEVVGILDWEFAGFYPEYWEFCKAHWRAEWEFAWANDGLAERVLDPYYSELVLIGSAAEKFQW